MSATEQKTTARQDGTRRPPALRRSWLFAPGGDRGALMAAVGCGADALIQELEDFTPPELRAAARAMSAEVMAAWRAAGIVACVRINPLEGDGLADLAGVIEGRPDAIHLPKIAEPAQVIALDAEITRHEARHGLPPGAIEIVPNIETARGIMQTYAIATASPRVTAVLCSTEDLAETSTRRAAGRRRNWPMLASACIWKHARRRCSPSTAPTPSPTRKAAPPMPAQAGRSATAPRARWSPVISRSSTR